MVVDAGLVLHKIVVHLRFIGWCKIRQWPPMIVTYLPRIPQLWVRYGRVRTSFSPQCRHRNNRQHTNNCQHSDVCSAASLVYKLSLSPDTGNNPLLPVRNLDRIYRRQGTGIRQRNLTKRTVQKYMPSHQHFLFTVQNYRAITMIGRSHTKLSDALQDLDKPHPFCGSQVGGPIYSDQAVNLSSLQEQLYEQSLHH